MTRPAPPVTARYRELLAERGYRSDPAQQRAASRLDAVMGRLQSDASQTGWQDAIRRWLRRPRVARPRTGLYLWGGVGRGKTFLMDLFFQQLPAGHGSRCHFHRFMRDVHARLNALRNVEDPLQDVAAGIASQARVLVLKDALGLPFEDVSRVTGVPVGTAKCYAHRARAGMRALLAEETGVAA